MHNASATGNLIVGIDEVGRGALAGPVVAGACIIPCELFRRRHSGTRWSPFQKKPDVDVCIADSKQLSPGERDISYEWIVKNCIFGAGIADVDVIETRGILAATQLAMLLALVDLETRTASRSFQLLIDGRDNFRFPYPHHSIIRGDQSEPCIAAGSIVAKVTRDRLMVDYAKSNNRYGFEKHKGYGSDDHIAAIRRHGMCPLHRLSFLSRILTEQQTLAFMD